MRPKLPHISPEISKPLINTFCEEHVLLLLNSPFAWITMSWPLAAISLLFFSRPIMSDSLQLHGLQHSRPPCPSPSPKVCPSSCPLHQWCYPTISFSDTLFSFCPQSFSTSGTFETKPKSANICSIDEWMVDKLIRKVSICISYYLSGCREIYLFDFRHANKRSIMV